MLLRGTGATRNAVGRGTATVARAGSLRFTVHERADAESATTGAMLITRSEVQSSGQLQVVVRAALISLKQQYLIVKAVHNGVN